MRFLIVDDYEEVRELIAFSLDSYLPVDVVFASSGNQAIERVKEDSGFDLIISDITMPNGTGVDLYQYLHAHKITIPLVLMIGDSLDRFPVLKNSGVYKIGKPFDEEELKKYIEKTFSINTSGTSEMTGTFIPVNLNLLKQIQNIEVPLFVKINEQKYIKLTHDHSSFGQGEFLKYHEKGVNHFYISGQDSETLIHEFKKKVLSNEAWREISVEDSAELISFNTELLKNLSTQMGWTDKLVDFAKHNSQRALSIAKSNPQMKGILQQFQKIERFGHSDHCTLLMLISCGLAEKLNIGDESTMRILTFASLFHDMTLSDVQFANKRKHLKAIESKDFGLKDTKEIHRHSAQAAEICKTWNFCPPDVDKLIFNHHEQPNGNGFPIGRKAQELNLLQALFIIAEDFAHYYIDNSAHVTPKLFSQSRKSVYNFPHFSEVLQVFDLESD